jgi:hypothetical protein
MATQKPVNERDSDLLWIAGIIIAIVVMLIVWLQIQEI